MYRLHLSSQSGSEGRRTVRELLQSMLRSLMLTIGAALLLGYLACNLSVQLFAHIVPVSVVLLVYWSASLVALWLNRRSHIWALAVWELGLAIAIVTLMGAFSLPEAAFLFILLPLLASIVADWPGGLVVEALVACLLIGVSQVGTRLGPMDMGISQRDAILIAAGGLLAGLIGWMSARTLLTVTQWAMDSWTKAREEAEQARDQRQQYKQTQQDLLRANNELARLTDQLQAMYDVAAEARRVKEEFVANVSHELRTPLNMIIGFSEMIVRSPRTYGERLPPALMADVTAIYRNSQHLAKLVDDVLDLSQVEAGRLALTREWADLAEIVAEALEVVRPLFQSKGLSLAADTPASLPNLNCDSTRIRQVIINLLSNAGRVTDRGGAKVIARCQAEEVVITVVDTGPGISSEAQSRLFRPFERLDTSIRGRQGGTGLGLSISKQFVEMHGGHMWLESEEGKGASFSFSLPIRTPQSQDLFSDGVRRWFSPYSEYEYRQRISPVSDLEPVVTPCLVIVEEGHTLQRLFARYVDTVEIVPVRNVDDALSESKRVSPEAVIVNAPDFRDPDRLLSALSSLPNGTPTIACWVTTEDSAAQELGVVRYLQKPITGEALSEALTALGPDVRTLLLVDDEPEILQLYSRMLSAPPLDYEIIQARSGRRALDLMHRRKPDALLLDLLMPELDGFGVLEAMSQDPALREIPVIIGTSLDPSGEPIASKSLTVARSGGLGMRYLLDCILAVTAILSPGRTAERREPRGRPPA